MQTKRQGVQGTLLSPVVAEGMRWRSRMLRMSLQMLVSSVSTFTRYSCNRGRGCEEEEGLRGEERADGRHLDLCDVALVTLGLLLLLNGGNDAPGRAAGADDVLVRDRQQVALLNGELNIEPSNLLHRLHHLVVPLRLFGDFGHVPAKDVKDVARKRRNDVHILLSAFVNHL